MADDVSHGHSVRLIALDLGLNDVVWVADDPACLACNTGSPHFDSNRQLRVISAIPLGLVDAKHSLEELVRPEIDTPAWDISEHEGAESLVKASPALAPDKLGNFLSVLDVFYAINLSSNF